MNLAIQRCQSTDTLVPPRTRPLERRPHKPVLRLAALVVGWCGLAAAGLSGQSTYDLFVKEFSAGQKFENNNAMQKAIASRPIDALMHYEALTRNWLAKREDGPVRATLDKMKELFNKQFTASKVIEHIDRYYERIDQERLNLLIKTEDKKNKLYGEWERYNKAGDREAVRELCRQGLDLGRFCEELGHKLLAGKVYNLIAMFQNQMPKKLPQDTRDAIETARLFMACRESWGWTEDSNYATWKNWAKSAAVQVAEDEKKSAERKKAGLDDSAAGIGKFVDTTKKPLVSTLTFRPLRALPKDLSFVGGIVPANWTMTKIADKATKMHWFKGTVGSPGKTELFLKREGGNKIGVVLSEREDAHLQSVQAGPKSKPSTFYLDKDKKRPYAMAFYIPGDQEPWASATSNMAPQKDSINVFYRSAASWVGELNGVEVTFFDDNCDGELFSEDPFAYGYKTRVVGKGPKEEVPVAVYDSMQIGKQLMPYSSCAKIGDTWFKLASADQGRAVEARPLHPDHWKIGTVTMKWSGPRDVRPQFLIIRGTGNLQAAAFDIGGGKPVEVPEGEYNISYGRAERGKGAQATMVHVFRGDAEPIKVEAAKNTVVKMGAPFKFDFVRGGSADDVVIDSLNFRVLGSGGELYCKIQGPTPAPEVVVAKNASGRGGKSIGEYVPISTPELLNAASTTLDAALQKDSVRTMGIEVAYFPVVKGSKEATTVLSFKSPVVGGLVGLRVKKHKLFGKIDPIFK